MVALVRSIGSLVALLSAFAPACALTTPRSPGRSLLVRGRAKLLASASEGADATGTTPGPGLQWFVKTETFCKPFPVVKPHLEAHREWVAGLRDGGYPHPITSGYRVDSESKPGGGGLMILAAPDHASALELVLQDPLVANECVEWQLNGWVSEVGGITLT